MKIISFILTVVCCSCVTTEAFYVHKIVDKGEIMPKTIQMCRRSCLKKVMNDGSNQTKTRLHKRH